MSYKLGDRVTVFEGSAVYEEQGRISSNTITEGSGRSEIDSSYIRGMYVDLPSCKGKWTPLNWISAPKYDAMTQAAIEHTGEL